MSEYIDVQNQINELRQRAKGLRRKELQSVISDIKQKIKQYEISAAELGFTETTAPAPAKNAPKPKSKRTASKAAPTIMYRNDEGQTWSGAARGRKPQWVTDALAAGEDLEKYRV